jgi:hypothetical protein
MKALNKVLVTMSMFSIAILTGCAAGAATAVTAGYSLKAQSADSLTADGEQRIIDRAKKEILSEMSMEK